MLTLTLLLLHSWSTMQACPSRWSCGCGLVWLGLSSLTASSTGLKKVSQLPTRWTTGQPGAGSTLKEIFIRILAQTYCVCLCVCTTVRSSPLWKSRPHQMRRRWRRAWDRKTGTSNTPLRSFLMVMTLHPVSQQTHGKYANKVSLESNQSRSPCIVL